jgi:hypothetical protein
METLVTEEEFRRYVSATQEKLGQLNESLRQIHDAIRTIGVGQSNALTIAAAAHDTSYLVVRTLAETNADFRTILMRFAQEPAKIPAAQESRDLLLAALAEHQRNSGERPTLRPVPPSGSEA